MHAPGGDAAKRQQLALEVCSDFRKVLDGMRMYARGHSVTETQVDKLHEHVVAFGALGEDLVYGVTSLALTLDDKPLQAAARLEESISHPLFADGVHQLRLGQGCTRPEVAKLVELWRGALDGKLGLTHTFATRFWEADLPHIKVRIGETLVVSSAGKDDDAAQRAGKLESLIALLSGDAPPGPDSQVVRGRAGAPKGPWALPEIGSKEADALAAELVAEHGKAFSRALLALISVSPAQPGPERDQLVATVAQQLAAQARAGQWKELGETLKQLGTSARAEAASATSRLDVLQAVFDALAQRAFVEPAVLALDDGKVAPHAEAVLKLLPLQGGQLLLELMSAVKTPEGKKRLAGFMGSVTPDAESLVQQLKGATPQLALELLAIAASLEPAKRWQVRGAALSHPHASVRRAAVDGVSPHELLQQRARLAPLLADADPAMRRLVFGVLGTTPDRGAVAPLIRVMGLGNADAAEKRRAAAALGQVGGGEACAALKRVLEHDGDAELRAVAALALGAAGDETARPLLKEHAGKLLGAGALKGACAEALKKLDEKRGAK
jgi:hypothetical protein